MPMASPSDKNTYPQLTPTQVGPSIASQDNVAQTWSFQGWENYPLTLTNYNTLSRNGSALSERLRSDSERLFDGPKNARLEILDVLETPDANCKLRLSHQIAKSLANYPPQDDRRFHFRCFVFARKLTLGSTITPKNSWGRLLITEEMLRKLLTSYKVSPDFLQVVHAFGNRYREWIPSSAVFRCLLKAKGTRPTAYVSEVCIRMVHVEKHGRVDKDVPDLDPWSVRQIGWYQRFDYEDDSSVCIHIMPPKAVKSRLVEALAAGRFSKGSERLSPVSLHLGFVTTAMQNWQAYVEDLESELTKRRECAYMTDKEWEACRRGGADLRARYSDFRTLQQYFRDKLLNTMSNFSLNMDVIQGLQTHVEELRFLGLLGDAAYKDASDLLEHNTSILRELRRDTERILEKAGNAAHLIQALFEIRNDTLIQSYTSATAQLVDMAGAHRSATGNLVRMAEDSQRDGQLMVAFADLTKRDSRTMKVATMLATLYLPGTFVATVFGMNFFHSDIEIKHGEKIYAFSVAIQLWIFGVVVLVLTAVTVTSFWLWERRLRRKDEKRALRQKSREQRQRRKDEEWGQRQNSRFPSYFALLVVGKSMYDASVFFMW
ncbi:hypothetical protein C7212DRAFT_285727 [Tuber magnatum]|uniref:CorA-like transporter domain-containing protein n=1 Tax=Tuber magnatum TaxID=42249 RepID=A0A317SGR3_9PEZI|nr:hypothetical protein C7212DRAFT_285727 [Tuber magnatum]